MRNPEKLMSLERTLVYPNSSKCQLTFFFSLFVSGCFHPQQNAVRESVSRQPLLYKIHLRPTLGVVVGVGVEEVGTACATIEEKRIISIRIWVKHLFEKNTPNCNKVVIEKSKKLNRN